jgi:predicted AlkP superfamily pyrophosphatase or phosphodiesterase
MNLGRVLQGAILWNFAKLLVIFAILSPHVAAQTAAPPTHRPSPILPQRPKLVVLLVVDQMRADYVDKFLRQWTGGLQRLVREGAWFRDAAYPYAATETCVGHATVSTGALPATHGMIANAWWDRETQKMMTCTADPRAKNFGYAGVSAKGGDSAWRMEVPAFAEELKFQTGGATRVVTFSLKARAAITMAGHKGDAVTWFESEGWVTSSAYGTMPFIEDYAEAHPVRADYGKTWRLSLPESEYWYDEKATNTAPPAGWDAAFPHSLRGKGEGNDPDPTFYEQWAASPFADAYLTELTKAAIDSLGLGKGGGTDFLGVSYSSLDYVGHAFGPRSREIQDMLVRLDKALDDLFTHLDAKVGRGNYVVALTADHGGTPTPEDMQRTGVDAGRLNLATVQESIERVLDSFNYPKPTIARFVGNDLYFAPGIYDKLEQDGTVMSAVVNAAVAQLGVAGIYTAEALDDRPSTHSPIRKAFAASYFPGRSGDMFIVEKPYWLLDYPQPGQSPRAAGTGHGSPYYYDQRVPILLMGLGIRQGEYLGEVTPVDIAPTLASLCGITLSSHDGHVLAAALAPTVTRVQAARPRPGPVGSATTPAKP